MLFSELDLIAGEPPGDGPWNMALDETLARSVSRPLLRIYGWAGSWISFGYFEKWEHIRRLAECRPCVRRWTGGGMVRHGEDWTYSLIIPAGHPVARLRPAESYARIHTIVAGFLAARGRPATLAGGNSGEGEGCFQRPVTADVLVEGLKVAGAAQRRTRHFFLHQGSVQCLDVGGWDAGEFARCFCAAPVRRGVTGEEQALAAVLAGERYASREWLERV